jgi:hypothetical protein
MTPEYVVGSSGIGGTITVLHSTIALHTTLLLINVIGMSYSTSFSEIFSLKVAHE